MKKINIGGVLPLIDGQLVCYNPRNVPTQNQLTMSEVVALAIN